MSTVKPQSSQRQKKKRKIARNRLEKKVQSFSSEEKDGTNERSTRNRMNQQDLHDAIATLSESILEDPTQAFSTQRQGTAKIPSRMQQLLDLAVTPSNEETQQLAILSILAVFIDIVPSYRIRLPTAAESGTQAVSKQTRQLWDYERQLLVTYQQYYQFLQAKWKQQKQTDHPPSPLQITCILSLCQLLQKMPWFNFRSNLLTIVLDTILRQQRRELPTVVSETCLTTLEHLFQQDPQGDLTLEATRKIAHAFKQQQQTRSHSIPLLRTFLSVPLRVHADEAEAAKVLQKQKKKKKGLASIEKELQESQAAVNRITLAKYQSDTLEMITVVYLRILKKSYQDDDAISVAHLPAALEGLAKFSHLMNLDTVVDLLDVLRNLLSSEQHFPLEVVFRSILTAFQTLQGPGKELQVDVKEFLMPLYHHLPRLSTEAWREERRLTLTDLVLKCLDLALIQRREYSTVRVAAFFKQSLTVSLHTPPSTSIALLGIARQLLLRYSSVLEQCLENEQDVVMAGEYNPNVEDPEHANPFATSAWELSLTKFHWEFTLVRTQAERLAQAKPLQLPKESPSLLQQRMTQQEDDLKVEFVRMRKKHPLEAVAAKERKRTRRNVRFVTPRAGQLRLIQE